MAIFIRILSASENGGVYTPPSKRLTFAVPANLPANQHQIWQDTTGQSVEEWTAYFAHCPFDMTMAVIANQNEKKFLVSASLTDEPTDKSARMGYAKSSLGYISAQFDLADRDGGLMGANARSGSARRTGFIRNMVVGLQNFYEGPAQIERVSSMSVGAGVYTWASYGATPVLLDQAAGQLKRQWQALNRQDVAKSIAPQIGQWVENFSSLPTRETYRSIFLQAAENPPVAQGLKALLLGETDFLNKGTHRYEDSGSTAKKYAPALNDDYRFHPQDPQFQAFFRQRLAGLTRN